MKKFIAVGIFFLLGAVAAFAQDLPRTEVYLGYQFARINSAINVPAFSANGGLGEIAFNFNKVFSGVASFPAIHNGNINNLHVDQTLFGYMFGPRVHFRFGRLTPFGEALFGASYDTRSFRVPNTFFSPVLGQPVTVTTRFVNSSTAFSMAVGGGLDLPINHRLSFRPIKLDYYLTRFQPIFIPGLGEANRDRNQNNLLYSTGINFRF
jgi:outer membrane immunogenic protein